MSDLIIDHPAAVYLIADHLDAMLAAGEDLLKISIDLGARKRSDGAAGPWDDIAVLVGKARELELSLLSRSLQARARAREMKTSNDAIARVMSLFVAGTAELADAATDLADTGLSEFDAGGDPLAYLRNRGMLAADAASLPVTGTLAITEEMLVARRIPLGPLLDMAARLLDVLDAAYDLYPEEQARSGAAVSPEAVPAAASSSLN